MPPSAATSRRVAAPQRRRGVALEDAIRAAAFAELSTVGYAAFSVESVAARARTGKASIYRRWPSKPELVLDVLLRELPEPGDIGIPPAASSEMTTADALRQVARAIAGVIASPAGDIIRAVKFEAANDPDLAKLVDDHFQKPRTAALRALLRRGVERGEVRADTDIELAADVLPAVIVHRLVMQGRRSTAADLTRIVDHVMLPLLAP